MARPKATPAETAARVERMADMMRNNLWVRGVSGPVLAKEWGISLSLVERLAAEASRAVAREVTDPARVKEDVSVVLRRDLYRASEASEFRAVASIADTWTKIVGARAAERHDVTVSAAAEYDKLADPDKAAWCEERAALLLAEARAIRARLKDADGA